jgi:hydrophobe/amphiphile efflux-1 (HAE1) family protein
VGDVQIFGARDYSMRLWLQPDKMARLGVTTGDIATAVNTQNAQFAAGKIGADPAPPGQQLVYTVTARGRLVEAEQFGEIVLRAAGPGGVLRLKDVARIELGAQSYDTANTVNGQPAIALAVFPQSGANALDVGAAIRQRMGELKRERFPPDVDYLIPYDTTRFVSASIKEVVSTIVEAAIIVVLVVFVFLQTWRATLIPILAVPVSLIGTFAGLWLAGFSINTLTLFAMVLAIGIVVDDAIVVLENVERLMREEKMEPKAAAIEAMREVSGAVVGIVLVLCAVFIPVAFLGGIAGQLYRQFAVTVAIAVVISGVVALTLTPALCALLLKREDEAHPGLGHRVFAPFNRAFGWITRRFVGAVDLALRHRGAALLCFGLLLGGAALLFTRVPGSFVPPEDQGYIIAAAVLPDGATLERTAATTERLRHMMDDNAAKENFFIVNGFDLIGGGSKPNSATMFLPMKPWDQRRQTAAQLAAEVSGKGFGLPDGIAFAFNPPAIQGLGQAGGFEVYVQARQDSDTARLAQVMGEFMAALRKRPELDGINSFFRPTVPQLRVDVDREKALALGVASSDVFAALQAQLGSLYINDFNKSGRTYRVTMQADARFRARPEDIGALYLRSSSGQMVPLKALVSVSSLIGPEQIDRYNSYVAAKVLGGAKPGYSSGEAIAVVEAVARETLPPGYGIEWTAQAFQEKRTGNASVFAFGFALIMVYLILSALYERWGVPLAVLLAVPFAITGALLLVFLRGMNNDIYFQIGLVVLIGLAAKNAILIAEFSMQGMAAGKSAAEAAREAARLRFRPIVMTSLAFVLGVVPLVIATGAGAAARQSMGTGVFGGMLVATFVAPIFVPLFFALLARKPRPVHSHGPDVQSGESWS